MREDKRRFEQWQVNFGGRYTACGETTEALPAGAYLCERDCSGNAVLRRHTLKVDNLIDVPDSVSESVLAEIDTFWGRRDRYLKYGFLHRRGYLFYGVQGSGKSSLIHQTIAKIVNAGHLALFCQHPYYFLECAHQLRRVEPDRPLVCVFEDIDATIERYGDSELLQWLDGNCQVDNAVNLASTNYPEKLDPRIVSRPRRFDRVLNVDPPSAAQRAAFLQHKVADLTQAQLEDWVERTSGLSFASLAELIISVRCLEIDVDESINILRKQHLSQTFGQDDAAESEFATHASTSA